ncbi:unnamed protein product [Aureobasidium vineae]|uniref:Uncharacterized protein n=1 Tax=Aureobasidium vineae TaxID=2773715 RepID=A0A9N8PCS2_9PEZI|nr:unnamed protein product [Aureobasidium vineae]
MVEEYIRQQHEWLGRLYPAQGNNFDSPPPQPTPDPQSPQWHTIQTFQDLLESKCQAQEAAKRLTNVTSSTTDFQIETLCNNMWGCIFSAVEHFSSIETLSALSNLLACLASLPQAINTHQEPMFIEGLGTFIQPGEPILLRERLWADLPFFSLNLAERMQGPGAYLSKNEHASEASRKWANMNTFVAILVRDHGTAFPTLFGSCVTYAFMTLSSALEHPPNSRLDRNTIVHLSAACRWILVARDVVREAVDTGYKGEPWTAMAGKLWQDQDGTDQVVGRRWTFWKSKFEILGGDLQGDAEMADIALRVSRLM